MKYGLSLKEDFPIFAVILLLHLADILAAATGRMQAVLWLVVLSSLVHFGVLGWITAAGRKLRPLAVEEGFVLEP